ncbi:MAG: hypothetical protein VR66_03635 [Peptococcaceae bacterium BRH_c23]|nr:MAG: hypothetical protein VR66_03635 [Peptococcaceae bacterium BRH_c23]KJS83258.1 MAG: hypothetical protein JL57_22830 [Desulfosporosinus sp. BICA1-9]
MSINRGPFFMNSSSLLTDWGRYRFNFGSGYGSLVIQIDCKIGTEEILLGDRIAFDLCRGGVGIA